MWGYLKAYFFDLRRIKQVELTLTQTFYFAVNPTYEVKKNLFLNNALSREDNSNYFHVLNNEIIFLKEKFRELPFSLQMKHIFDINLFQDNSTLYDENILMDYAIASRGIIYNYLLVSYAETILLNLPKDQKNAFLDKVNDILGKGVFGANTFEDYELKMIAKWKLENQLTETSKPIKRKLVKI